MNKFKKYVEISMIFLYLIISMAESEAVFSSEQFSSSNGKVSYSAQKPKPHIILIVADDLGFNDVPWHNPSIVAPNIASLAKEGIILEQSYVQPICSPSRAAILSGRYPFTIGRQHDVLWPLMPTGLTLDGPILPQYLKDLGYSTHAVGKWHLGFCKWAYTPTERGFDSFRGYYTGSEDYYTHMRHHYTLKSYQNKQSMLKEKDKLEDKLKGQKDSSKKGTKNEHIIDKKNGAEIAKKMNGYDFRNNREPYFNATGHYSTYEFASRVEEILESSDPNESKFIYMAFQSVHSPLEVPENYTYPYLNIKDRNRRTYLGMVTAMDEAIGRIVEKLKSSGHYDNTVIAFTTDNGGPTITGGNNWPLRGNKTTLWEGGTRGAAFVHSPLLKNGGTISNLLFHTTDWLSTFVSLAGGDPPTNTSGFDQWSALTGQGPPKRDEVVYNIDAYKEFSAAIRYENFKLIVGNPGPGEWTPPPTASTSLKQRSKLATNADTLETYIENYQKRRKISKRETKTIKAYDKNRNMNKVYERKLRLFHKMNKNCKNFPKCLKNFTTEHKDDLRTLSKADSLWNKLNKKIDYYWNKWFSRWNVGDRVQTSPKSAKNKKLKNINFQTIENVEQLLAWDDVRLYNLLDDPEERHDLSKEQPDKVRELALRLIKHSKSYVAADYPPNDVNGDPENFGHVWSPGWC